MKLRKIGTSERKNLKRCLQLLVIVAVMAAGLIGKISERSPVSASVSAEMADPVMQAMYTREDFFGEKAYVPLPATKARENLDALLKKKPDDLNLILTAVDLDEKLSDYQGAERLLKKASELKPSELRALANFYSRRGRYEDQAAVVERIFRSKQDGGARSAVLAELISLARKHRIEKYLNPDFYDRAALSDPGAFPVFQQLIKAFNDDGDYKNALEFVRRAKKTFPGHKDELLELEVSALEDLNRGAEAESVYVAGFDPFWSEERSDDFYSFLSRRDRLREYGRELKARFTKDPSDFDTGIRLAHYRIYSYESGAPVIAALESNKRSWTPEELTAAARVLLRDGDGDLASRFLYTLFRSPELTKDKATRAKVLYQLFEVFSDAEKQRLSLAPGGLGFYADVARSDSDPGISSGLLSLIFADSDPGGEFASKQKDAAALYNREAAFRIFSAYRKEFTTSPQLAQMYLDLIRLYTATGDTKVAGRLLREFEDRHEQTGDYPRVAFRLAEAFQATGDLKDAEDVCKRLLARLGGNGPVEGPESGSKSERFPGIRIPAIPNNRDFKAGESGYSDEYYYGRSEGLSDYLGADREKVTYAAVLQNLVDLLAKEGKTLEILSAYSDEIKRHPDSEWLYEARIKWLQQANLADSELEAYNAAVKRFKTNKWREKLARFLLRRDRRQEFADYSENVAKSLGDADIQNYLSAFDFTGVSTDSFRQALSEKLYEAALKRFPLNLGFAKGLLSVYAQRKEDKKWMELSARYFFLSETVRESYLDRLAKNGELRNYLAKAPADNDAYLLFRANAYSRLSIFEKAYPAYVKLSETHPDIGSFVAHAKDLARSFGETERGSLEEAAKLADVIRSRDLSNAAATTEYGEILAELGRFDDASKAWEGLIDAEKGDKEAYLDNATVNWDYFRFAKAREAISRIRSLESDDTLYSFETGAILESEHDLDGAVVEYVKALDTKQRDDDQRSKATKRLISLSRRSKGKAAMIEKAFTTELSRRRSADHLKLAYSDVLAGAGNKTRASELLNAAIRKSDDEDFLKGALDHYDEEEDPYGAQLALRRISEVANNQRDRISYSLRLADSLRETRQPEAAKAELALLVARYPTNYGVIVEASDFFRRIGYDDYAVRTLSTALLKARGSFRLKLAQKLAQTEVETGRLDEAAELLEKLHRDFGHDPVIFRALAAVYVRQNRPDALRRAFRETLDSLQSGNSGYGNPRREIYSLRREMVDAFTRLNDPSAALDQYIEIINSNNAETEQLTDGAIAYAQRYGGISRLIRYYTKVSNVSFKNYRWNLVLAKLYESEGDIASAVKNMNLAVVNEPNDAGLYLKLSSLEASRGRFQAAIKAVDRSIELSEDTTAGVEAKVAILRKFGKNTDADALEKKLPKVAENASLFDKAAAEKDASEALVMYRKAFEALLSDPAGPQLKLADLENYVNARRDADGLEKANEDLWQLRERLQILSKKRGTTNAREAKVRLETVYRAIVGSIGRIAKERADNRELADLYRFLKQKIDSTTYRNDPYGNLSLVSDLSRAAGFGKLEEALLIKGINEAQDSKQRRSAINSLADWYEARGAYSRIEELYRDHGIKDYAELARISRLNGDKAGELEALDKAYHQGSSAKVRVGGAVIDRYLSLLYEHDRKGLEKLTEESSVHQFRLINFLLAKGEKRLVHKAITSANMPEAWKLSRNAEASLALKEFSNDAECYFCAALNLGSIGELVKQEPDKKQFLVNDDWFRLSAEYGNWLEKAEGRNGSYLGFLPAMVENRPKDASEQLKLGRRMLQEHDIDGAIAHLLPASELEPSSAPINANLGTAYYLKGQLDKAEQVWGTMDLGKKPLAVKEYLRALHENGLDKKMATDAKRLLRSMINSDSTSNEDIGDLVRSAAQFIPDDTARVSLFESLAKRLADRTRLLNLLINDSLVPDKAKPEFLKLLIESSDPYLDSDYGYVAILRRGIPDRESAETAYDQENGYGDTSEPYGSRFQAQRQLVEKLYQQNRLGEAQKAASEIERELADKWARPAWLRLKIIAIGIRTGAFDEEAARRFVGIDTGSSPFASVRPPDLERLNEILRVLNKPGMKSENASLRRDFYSRKIALGEYDNVNFAGLARAFFDLDDPASGRSVLDLLVEAYDPATRDVALGRLGALPSVVKARPAAGRPFRTWEPGLESRLSALETAARVAAEYGLTDKAIKIRNKKRELNPVDSGNRLKLGELLYEQGKKSEAVEIWKELTQDRFALRPIRWTAVSDLLSSGKTVNWTTAQYDTYSLQLSGSLLKSSGKFREAIDAYSSAMIADESVQNRTRVALIELYAAHDREFAAITFSSTLKDPRSDELCRTLSEAAERAGELRMAADFERSRKDPDRDRLKRLEEEITKREKKFTDFEVNKENTKRQ